MTDENLSSEDKTVIRKRAASKFVTYFTIGLIGLYMLVTSAIQTWNAVVGAETRQTIIDCVEVGGACNTRNQESTGDVVQKIVDEIITTRHVSVLAAACATDPTVVTPDMVKQDRIDAVDLCVQKQLQRERDAREEASTN